MLDATIVKVPAEVIRKFEIVTCPEDVVPEAVPLKLPVGERAKEIV